MMTKPGFQILLWICLMSLSVSGQHSQRFEVHSCTHLCAHTRLNAPLIGIYNQDPRVHDYDVKFYGLDLEVVPWSTYLDGSVRILAEIVRPETRFLVVELTDNLSVSKILWNGTPLAFQHYNDIIEIDLGEEKEKGTLVDVEIYYSGEPIVEGFFSGIQSAQNNFGDHVLWTLSEPHNARQWFPCKQVLNDKADSVYVFLTTPPGYMAASNGLLKNITPLSDGRLRHEWKSYYPIAFYLISMAVSNYQEYNFFAPLSDNSDSVLVQNFIYNYPQALERNKENLEQTKPMMQLFSQLWGDYPFAAEKYGHAHAPMGGAMEHQTMSTMGYFGFDITAHELAHHWFGNNVTCATWSDIWINEGFASYGEYLAREFIVGKESARQWMNAAHSNIKAVPDGSVFVPAMQLPDIWRIFNGRLTYRKGAAILHQLRFEINDDDLFFYIMEDFQNQYADSVASGDDFRKAVDNHTGQSWEWFFDQWYYGEGYPVYEITWWQIDDRLFIRSAQNTSSPLQDFFAGTLEFILITDNDEEIPIRFFQHSVLQEFEITINGDAEQLIFDPSGFMLKDYIILDSTQLNNPDLLPFTIYPNPFSDYITIDYQDALHNSSVLISDLQGRIILEEQLTHPSQRLNSGNLAQGIYLVTIISPAGNKQTIKMMKH